LFELLIMGDGNTWNM